MLFRKIAGSYCYTRSEHTNTPCVKCRVFMLHRAVCMFTTGLQKSVRDLPSTVHKPERTAFVLHSVLYSFANVRCLSVVCADQLVLLSDHYALRVPGEHRHCLRIYETTHIAL
jgi:hypothetical protein